MTTAAAAIRMALGCFVLVIGGTALAQVAEEPCRVRVIEGRAALFASTNALREVVAWQPSGTELEVLGELTDEAWVRVSPPENVHVWVYRELVKDGVVLADKSRVRSGAGLHYRPVGSLRKGDRVEVRGSYGDWLKIKPPAEVSFWMLRDQVEPLALTPPEGSETNLAGEVACAAVTNPAVASAGVLVEAAEQAAVQPAAAQPPPELAGYALDGGMPGQGAAVELSGILDWGTVGEVTAPFCLVARQADGDTLPVCHLLVPQPTGTPDVGATVTVKGTRWRVKGSTLPVVVAESLRVSE